MTKNSLKSLFTVSGLLLFGLMGLLALVACTDEGKLSETSPRYQVLFEWEKPIQLNQGEVIEVGWKLMGEGNHFLHGKKVAVGLAIVPEFYMGKKHKDSLPAEKPFPVLSKAVYFNKSEAVPLTLDTKGHDQLEGALLINSEIINQARQKNGGELDRNAALFLIWYAVDQNGFEEEVGKRSVNLKMLTFLGPKGSKHKYKLFSQTESSNENWLLPGKGRMRQPLPEEIQKEFKDYNISFRYMGETSGAWLILADRFKLKTYQ